MSERQHPLEYYLSLEYPYTVVPDDGSFFIEFPDLPGCMTQVEDASEIGAMADEIRTLWLETTYYDTNLSIPEPVATEYSGKFVARVPKSLHRDLAESAKREGMSLNAYVCYLLAERNVSSQLSRRLDEMSERMTTIFAKLPDNVEVESTSDEDARKEGPTHLHRLPRLVKQ